MGSFGAINVHGEYFKNTYELLNLWAFEMISALYVIIFFNIWDILCGILKVPFQIPHKICDPIHWKMCILLKCKSLGTLRFNSL